MIGKLRMKFVAVCMALVTSVLLAVLLAIYLIMNQNLIRISDQLLDRAIQNERLLPNVTFEMNGAPVMLPYFTVTLRGTTAYITSGTYEELKDWYSRSGLPLKKFFNTSGLLYKSLNLKEKLPAMSEEEQLRLLATDGMLVKRPIVVTDRLILTGFKEADWEKLK